MSRTGNYYRRQPLPRRRALAAVPKCFAAAGWPTESGRSEDRGQFRLSSAGFTLMELMAVIAVLGILLGIGAASLMNISKGYEALSEAAVFTSYLQGTRNLAVSSGIPAQLRVSKIDGVTVLNMRGLQPAGAFLMEDTTGAFGMSFALNSATIAEGVSGSCLMLDNAAGIVNLGNDPRWALSDGFLVEFWTRCDTVGAGAELLEKENLFAVDLIGDSDYDGLANIYITAVLHDMTVTGLNLAETPVEYGTWFKIGVSWNEPDLKVYLNDVQVHHWDFPNGLSGDDSGDLLLFQDSPDVTCCIDELVIYRLGTVEERSLSDGVTIQRLELNLADADPDNDFLLYEYMPDGRILGLAQAQEFLHFRNSTGIIRIEESGEVYVQGL